MRRLSLAATLLVLALSVPALAQVSMDPRQMQAGTWTSDRAHTFVTARVRHLGVSFFVMRFNAHEITLTGDPARPAAARVSASVDTTSLDVGAEYSRRFADQFLEASRNPRMTFVSTEVAQTGQAAGTLTGNLTIRGVTRPVTFQVAFNGVGPGLMGGSRAGFTATTTIKRSEFGSTFLENVVGDDVTIQVDAELQRR